MRRLIKDPFYKDLGWIDLDIKTINEHRASNNLHAELAESDINFDENQYIKDYAYKIGAVKPVLKKNKAELWYYADLDVIRHLKKYGSVWEWDFMDELQYISNYEELIYLETDEDRQNKAERLQDGMNDQLWKHGGRVMGDGYETSVIELNGGMLKYFINSDMDIEVTPHYTPTTEQLEVLETIKNELS